LAGLTFLVFLENQIVSFNVRYCWQYNLFLNDLSYWRKYVGWIVRYSYLYLSSYSISQSILRSLLFGRFPPGRAIRSFGLKEE